MHCLFIQICCQQRFPDLSTALLHNCLVALTPECIDAGFAHLLQLVAQCSRAGQIPLLAGQCFQHHRNAHLGICGAYKGGAGVQYLTVSHMFHTSYKL